MKVKFDCQIFEWHNDHYVNLKKELLKRGHVITTGNEADFLIAADEAYNAAGAGVPDAKCIWIGHGFEAKSACINDDYSLQRLEEHADYLFVYSSFYKNWLAERIKTPSYITGMTKLDGLKHPIDWVNPVIVYAPTFNEELSSIPIMEKKCNTLRQYGEYYPCYHPIERDKKLDLNELLGRATIVISDYSSVGFEAIALGIPTILIDNEKCTDYRVFPPENYLTNQARKAAVCVSDFESVVEAIKMYYEDHELLQGAREYYGRLLNEHIDESSKRAVDIMEKIYEDGLLQGSKASGKKEG